MTPSRRVLLHVDDNRRIPVEPEEVFFLRARIDDTEVRTRGRRRLRDLRPLDEVAALFPEGLFVKIHRGYAINVDRVAEVRRRDNGRDWEVKIEPPVNRILPVARGRVDDLWRAYGED